ncbi:response regulator [Desulfocicer niacini]
MKNRNIIIICLISMLLGLPPIYAGDTDAGIALTAEESAWINERHTVRIRIGNAPPFMINHGKIEGISIDYLTQIFNRYNIAFTYVSGSDVTWPEALDYIHRHEVVDMVPTAKITEARKTRMLFTDEYIFAPWVIFTRTHGDFISSMNDLRGKTISVQEGYVMHEKLKKEYPEIKLKVVPANKKDFALIPIADLSTGLVDAYIGNLLLTTYVIQTRGYTNIKVAAPTPFDNHNQAMAIRNDWPELVSIINKTLAEMTPKEHAAIRNKWLNIRYEYGINTAEVFRWVAGIVGVALLFIAWMLFWNKRLKAEVEDRIITEDRYKKAQRMGKVGNWEYDLVTKHFWGSDEARRIYGFATGNSAFTVDEVENCIPDRERVHQALVDLIEKDIPYNLEFEINPATGSEKKVIQSVAEVIKDDADNPIKVTGVIQDITWQVHARQENKRLELQLQQNRRLEAIGTLAGGIAHDFNNILYPIIGFTELSMEDLPENHPVKENLKDILQGAKRARDLVKQILSFSSQRQEPLKPLRLEPLIQEASKLLRATIPSTIDIQQELDDNIYVTCNPTEIHEIIMNLCTNAYHAMEDKGGILKVCLKEEIPDPNLYLPLGAYCCLSIKDTGAGMSPEIMDHIFNPYFTTKSLGKGSGLGLSVIHGIIKNYKGAITVESEPGEGSVFKVYLPMASPDGITPEMHDDEAIHATGNEKILFVEDEEAIVKLGVLMLERMGYQVTGQVNSLEALDLFKSAPDQFDLVITDMSMPHMVGTDLAQKIMDIRPDIPVIICTGFSEHLDEAKALSLGIRGYIKKPLLRIELSSAVQDALAQQALF